MEFLDVFFVAFMIKKISRQNNILDFFSIMD
jgi:hypothetical protein